MPPRDPTQRTVVPVATRCTVRYTILRTSHGDPSVGVSSQVELWSTQSATAVAVATSASVERLGGSMNPNATPEQLRIWRYQWLWRKWFERDES